MEVRVDPRGTAPYMAFHRRGADGELALCMVADIEDWISPWFLDWGEGMVFSDVGWIFDIVSMMKGHVGGGSGYHGFQGVDYS